MSKRTTRILTITVFIVYAVSGLLSNFYLLALQLDSKKTRMESIAQRDYITKQNNSLFCVLQLPPTTEARTDAAIKQCQEKNGIHK